MVARKKRVKGTLNIEDNSEDEDIEHVHLWWLNLIIFEFYL